MREVTLSVQKRALADCGITDPRGLIVLHNIRTDYEWDEWMMDIPVYVRTDRFFDQNHLEIGMKCPDAALHYLDGTEIKLSAYIEKAIGGTNKYMVLISGSAS